jgi:hypothetical protein
VPAYKHSPEAERRIVRSQVRAARRNEKNTGIVKREEAAVFVNPGVCLGKRDSGAGTILAEQTFDRQARGF